MQVDMCVLLAEAHQHATQSSHADMHSEATPMPHHATARKQGLHLEEAKALCPEGREATDSYHQTAYQGKRAGVLCMLLCITLCYLSVSHTCMLATARPACSKPNCLLTLCQKTHATRVLYVICVQNTITAACAVCLHACCHLCVHRIAACMSAG